MEQEIEQVQRIYDILVEFFVTYSFQLVGAIFIFVAGLWVAKKLASVVQNLLLKNKIDQTLSKFLASTVKVIVIVMFAIISLGKVGISVTPFVAAIGAASLGAGLAFQGLLSNYGAGMTIIVTSPFKLGHTISVKGVTGVVKDIHLGMTVLTNEDEQEITIPNRHIVGEILHNSFANTLVSGEVGIAYTDEPERAISCLKQVILTSGLIDNGRAPQIGIDHFGDSRINLGFRCWVPTVSYYQNKYALNQLVFETLKREGFTIPFPQREISIVGSAEPK